MRILDRYILKSTLSIFLLCIFLFLFLYIIIDVLSHLEDILRNRNSILVLLHYYLLFVPIMFVQIAPFACLLSTLYTFGRMNHNNEIIAMRSSGLSILQITKTVLVMAALVSLTVFWVNDRFVPGSMSLTQEIKEQLEKGKKKSKADKREVIDNLCMYGSNSMLFFVNKFNIKDGAMEGITILQDDPNQNPVRKIVANKGIYENRRWKFYRCISYKLDSEGQIIGEPEYLEEKIMDLTETPQDFLNQRERTEMMNIAQLDDYLWKLPKSGASAAVRKIKIELYQRFALPLTSFIIVILGIPFALRIGKRTAGLSSIGLSILVGIFYFMLDAVFVALGKGGTLSPVLSVSLSHIIALSSGLYLISKLP